MYKTLFENVYDNMENITSLTEFFFKKKPQKSPEELKKELDDDIEKLYNDFKKWWSNPHTLGDGYDNDILVMARFLRISEKDLCKKCLSSIKLRNASVYTGDDKNDLSKITKVFKSGKVCPVLENDDYLLAVEPNEKVLYRIEFSSSISVSRFNYTGNESLQFDNSDISNWISENHITFRK